MSRVPQGLGSFFLQGPFGTERPFVFVRRTPRRVPTKSRATAPAPCRHGLDGGLRGRVGLPGGGATDCLPVITVATFVARLRSYLPPMDRPEMLGKTARPAASQGRGNGTCTGHPHPAEHQSQKPPYCRAPREIVDMPRHTVATTAGELGQDPCRSVVVERGREGAWNVSRPRNTCRTGNEVGPPGPQSPGRSGNQRKRPASAEANAGQGW